MTSAVAAGSGTAKHRVSACGFPHAAANQRLPLPTPAAKMNQHVRLAEMVHGRRRVAQISLAQRRSGSDLLAFSGATEGVGVAHGPESRVVNDGTNPLVDSGGLGLTGAGDIENPNPEGFDEALQPQGGCSVMRGFPREMQAGSAQFPGEIDRPQGTSGWL